MSDISVTARKITQLPSGLGKTKMFVKLVEFALVYGVTVGIGLLLVGLTIHLGKPRDIKEDVTPLYPRKITFPVDTTTTIGN